MRALLDTNIIIHRETSKVINEDIGTLYRWLERGNYTKCVHSETIKEIKKYNNKETVKTFEIKLESYELIDIPSPINEKVLSVSNKIDVTPNDKIDTQLLNEVFLNRVDILVSEDKKIHTKANLLGISEKVFTIDSFLEKVFAEHPDLVNYKVLNVQKIKFGQINLNDPFFDSLKADYQGFENWYLRKFDEEAYITINSNNGRLLSFLYLKVENEFENYSDISPAFSPKKRLKVGTFKVISNGLRLGERFLKIIFDNALKSKVDEIYVTIFDKSDNQKRLINLLEQWGFSYWGKKKEENVYIKSMLPKFDVSNIKSCYPYVSANQNIFIVPIYPEYHTDLLPDSILNTESPIDFVEDFPHRNAISKVYVSRAMEPHPNIGDILIFYRTGGFYKSVVTTIGIVTGKQEGFANETEFISYCHKGSVFPDDELRKMWNWNQYRKPFVINFLYVYSFPNRINMQKLIDMKILFGVNDAPRGFKPIAKEQFLKIMEETKSEKSFIVD